MRRTTQEPSAPPAALMGLAALLAAATLFVFAASAQAAGSGSPKIHAKPHNLMVNTSTMLTGRHFPSNETITLSECGSTHWLAPADPCLHADDVTVTTNAKGSFETIFKVGVCEGEPTKKPTSRFCWVGELVYGEDTGELVGAAKLIVTYP